MYFKF